MTEHPYSEAVRAAERSFTDELDLQRRLHAARTASAYATYRKTTAQVVAEYLTAKAPLEQNRDVALRLARHVLLAETGPADADLAHATDQAEEHYAATLRAARKELG
jgi:hypothetical protein